MVLRGLKSTSLHLLLTAGLLLLLVSHAEALAALL